MAFIRALISFITAVLFSLSLMPGPRTAAGVSAMSAVRPDTLRAIFHPPVRARPRSAL